MIHPSRIPTVAILIFVIMYYPHPCLLAKSSIAAQNRSHRANVICDGSTLWMPTISPHRTAPTVPMLSVTDRHCGCPRYHRTAERYSCCPRSADEAAHAWRLLRRWPAGNLRRPEYGKAVRTYAFAGGIVRTLRCCLKMYARP